MGRVIWYFMCYWEAWTSFMRNSADIQGEIMIKWSQMFNFLKLVLDLAPFAIFFILHVVCVVCLFFFYDYFLGCNLQISSWMGIDIERQGRFYPWNVSLTIGIHYFFCNLFCALFIVLNIHIQLTLILKN